MAVSLDDFETHLFKCADIIRDAVDPTDNKDFILPLVYYKSISDEFEKQYAENTFFGPNPSKIARLRSRLMRRPGPPRA